jgi:hypothetical protein
MGWTGLYTSRPTKEILCDELTWSQPPASGRVVDICTKGGVSYVALEHTEANRQYIIGLVILHHRRNGEFAYKIISEDMGPYESRCPARILAQLSPVEAFAPPGTTSHEYATNWREHCREALRNNITTISDGTVLRFAKPLTFTDGAVGDTFTLCKMGRRTRFLLVTTGGLYRITHWKDREFKIVEKKSA